MLILAGLPLGLRFVVWDPDPASPAGKLSTRHFCDPYYSRETLEEFARQSTEEGARRSEADVAIDWEDM